MCALYGIEAKSLGYECVSIPLFVVRKRLHVGFAVPRVVDARMLAEKRWRVTGLSTIVQRCWGFG